MSDQAIKYLRENKGKYKEEELAKTLRDAGYDTEDVRMSVSEVFGGESSKSAQVSSKDQSFWNFSETKIYANAGQKWLDFLFGIFVPGLAFWVFSVAIKIFDPYFYSGDMWGLFFLAELGAIMYFWNRRRLIRLGIFAQILVYPIVIILFLSLFFSF